MKALKKYRWPLTGALLGVLVFLAVYGVRVLDPTSVDWILNSLSPDPIQHYLGWELFRRSPVHLPYIGANYNAVYPFRTSVLFTDSLPLAAVLTPNIPEAEILSGMTIQNAADMERAAQTISEKYGSSPRAWLIVSVVGAFLIDLINAVVITWFGTL